MTKALKMATLAAVGVLAVSGSAIAERGGKGGGGSGGGSSIDLVVLTSLSLRGQVTFTVSTSRTDYPWVNVRCSQGPEVVYSQWHGFFPSYEFGQVFTLGPTPSWSSGGASCTARLVSWDNGRDRTLATTSFEASG